MLPRRALLRDPGGPLPLTDPIVLDAYTHLLGCWGLHRLAEGDLIFPLRLGALAIFGADPPEGSDVPCRIAIKEVDRHRIRVDAEILRPDGTTFDPTPRWQRRHRDRDPYRRLILARLDQLTPA